LGELRRKNPLDIAFIERHLVWVAEQRYKAEKEAARKARSKKPHRKH